MPPHDSAEHPTPAAADLGPVPEGVVCPDCGYDLRGLLSDRCPECGGDILALRRQESLLPWRLRAERGRLRAFWQTVWWVTFRPRRFHREVAVPQPLSDARRFWLLTYLHTVAGLTLILLLFYVQMGLGHLDALRRFAAGGAAVILLVALWLLPGLATYFLQTHRFSPEHEARVRALSHYMWGILAWSLGLGGLLAFTTWAYFTTRHMPYSPTLLGALADFSFAGPFVVAALFAALLILLELRLYSIARRMLYRSRMVAFIALLLFNLAAVMLVALLTLVPLTLIYYVLIYISRSF